MEGRVRKPDLVMPEWSPEVWTGIGLVLALIFGGMLGKVWRPLRKTVAAVDVLAGRPERYPGDPEAKPGLAERLDTLDESVTEIRSDLNKLREEVQDMGCPDGK
jgi:hypothetical protein